MNIKHTKPLDAIFKRYGVVLRKANSTVEHAMNGCETMLTPIEFAVYESAIKALHCSYIAAGQLHPDFARWHERIAKLGGFTLPTEADEGIEAAKAYASDYHRCVRLLGDRYMELFD